MVVHLQRLHLANVKTFLGQKGMGFHADIKLSRKTIGTVHDYAQGDASLDVYVEPKYRKKYNAAIETFIENMSNKGDKFFESFSDVCDNEQTFIEYWLKMTEVEKTARSLFRKGAKRVFIVGYFVPLAVADVTGTLDEVGAFEMFGHPEGYTKPTETVLKEYQKETNKPYFNYIRELTDLEALSQSF